MNTYDWIVIGAGITGAAIAYELVKQKFSVLLLDRDQNPSKATLYSYGGLAYWSANTPATKELAAAGINLHRHLSEELGSDTEFREDQVLLLIEPDVNPQSMADYYQQFAIKPQLLTVQEACQLEPLLNPSAFSGALLLPHGHLNPLKTNLAYLQAFDRLGGQRAIANVTDFLRTGAKIIGVKTADQNYFAPHTVLCAGGWSRSLLQQCGISIPLYFSHAEIIKTPPVSYQLKTLIMSARLRRLEAEIAATQGEKIPLWDQPGNEPYPPIFDPGIIQFKDGSLRLGQITRVLTDPQAIGEGTSGEQEIRTNLAKIMPIIADQPGTWHRCLVAFSPSLLPQVGAIESVPGLYLFSGFTNTLIFAPPLARQFAINHFNY